MYDIDAAFSLCRYDNRRFFGFGPKADGIYRRPVWFSDAKAQNVKGGNQRGHQPEETGSVSPGNPGSSGDPGHDGPGKPFFHDLCSQPVIVLSWRLSGNPDGELFSGPGPGGGLPVFPFLVCAADSRPLQEERCCGAGDRSVHHYHRVFEE